MKTDDLIAALVADRRVRRLRLDVVVGVAALIGGFVSYGAFSIFLGVRDDIWAAMATWRFDIKMSIILLAVVLSFRDCLQLAKPVPQKARVQSWIAVPALLVAAVFLELLLVPGREWSGRAAGTNAFNCLFAIPALSIAPLVAITFAMRAGAAISPAAAGAAGGQLAAAVAAAMYALHCFDDSPLFVALWYPLAALTVLAAGALAGRWVLRW